AFGVDAARGDALAHEVGLHRFGAAHRELHVVSLAAEAIGVPDRDHHFEGDVAQLADEVVELGARIGTDHVAVEVEKHGGRGGDLLRLGSGGGGRWCGGRGGGGRGGLRRGGRGRGGRGGFRGAGAACECEQNNPRQGDAQFVDHCFPLVGGCCAIGTLGFF